MLRTASLAIACAFAVAPLAQALDPAALLSQHAHTAWRIQDGYFRGSPRDIVQTADGYVWIGTDSGIVRFDGVRFVPWDPGRDGALPSEEVNQLLASRDGSLWIATFGGLSQWKSGRLTNQEPASGGVIKALEDRHGGIWFGRRFPDADHRALCRVTERGTQCVGPDAGVPLLGAIGALVEGRDGALWVGADTTLLRWADGAATTFSPTGLRNNSGISGITAVAEAPDGTMWIGMTKAGAGLGLQRLIDGQWTPFVSGQLDGSSLSVSALYFDREGTLWVGTLDAGVYRIAGGRVTHFNRASGLSGNFVTSIIEDHEGSIWIVTSQGVDRFSDSPVVAWSSVEGLCSPEAASVLAGSDGSIWTGGDGALTRMHGGNITCFRTGRELPGAQVTSLFEDRRGRLWVGIDDGLWVFERGSFRSVRRLDGRATGLVTSIVEDHKGQIWVAVSGPPRIVLRIDGVVVRQEYREAPLPRRLAVDGAGAIWMGLLSGDLAHLHDGVLDTYRYQHDAAAALHQLDVEADGSVLAATSYGLIAYLKGRQAILTTKNGLPCDGVHAFVFDAREDLWLFLSCGLVRVTREDLAGWKADGQAVVSPQTLDEHDGVRVGRAAFTSAARSADGRLWFANGLQLQTVDPARLHRNAMPPPVHIEQIVADRQAHHAENPVRLPALTRDLQIDYVGLSFVSPQKVVFRYRLEGRDTTWQEPGTRRQAFYSDLAPGRYRFTVIASNNDGVWNEAGAAVDLIIAPAWYQTTLFMAVAVSGVALVSWAVYRLRVRHVAAALKARFDERLAERTRVARDLHDTLLQTVQGSKMVADHALERPDDTAGLRQAMAQVSTWLGNASEEGRAAVSALRASATERNDLAAALRRAIDDCAQHGAMETALRVTGEPGEMHPVVRDEVYRIGYEAIRNACMHSRGSRLDVTLSYAKNLVLRVVDNGVGIDATLAEHGTPGHFGVRSMRERAQRIGATLSIAGGAQGTQILLVVPARSIFARRGWRLSKIRGHRL